MPSLGHNAALFCSDDLLKRHYELHISGSTRALFGAGCVVKHLLMGDEAAELTVSMPSSASSEESFRRTVESLCPQAQVTCFITDNLHTLPCIFRAAGIWCFAGNHGYLMQNATLQCHSNFDLFESKQIHIY